MIDKNLQASSQLFVSVFENETEDVYLITNNTIVTDTSFVMKTEKAWKMTMDGKCIEGCGHIKVTKLNAGESVLIEVRK